MARTIPPTKTLSIEDRDLLRAIYYGQQLPRKLFVFDTAHLGGRLQILEMAGYVTGTSADLRLTDTGRLMLRRAFNGKKPPMIDTLYEAKLDPQSKRTQFVVGSSLASMLAREVRIGE